MGIVDEKEKQSPSSVLDSVADYPDMTDELVGTDPEAPRAGQKLNRDEQQVVERVDGASRVWRKSESGDGVENSASDDVQNSRPRRKETVEMAEPAPPDPGG